VNDIPVESNPSAVAADAAAVARNEDSLYSELEATGRPGQVARAWLQAVREELAVCHFAGAGGIAIVAEFTGCIDRMVRALYRYAERQSVRRFPKLNQRLAVVARGGYGRGELNPQSDIDLLFLHDYKPGPYVEVVTEIMLHAMWDAGLTVGHVVRNVRESVRSASADLKEKTAILDTRFLAGDDKLYAMFDKALVDDVLNRDQQKFFQAKLAESRERHRHYGDSIYLLEPQIKDGEGGLRDLHTALWLAKVKYKTRSLRELVQKAVISEPELEEVMRAQDFLFRVRN
jgi:[protein-PII] uridylyltransferase